MSGGHLSAVAVVLATALVAGPAAAVPRTLLRVEPWSTEPAGALDLETWDLVEMSYETGGFDALRFEAVLGLTHHLDLSLWSHFEESFDFEDVPLHLTAWHLGLRYRLDPGRRIPWRLAFFVALGTSPPPSVVFDVEERFIAEVPVGKVTFAANLVGHQYLFDPTLGHSLELDVGVRAPLGGHVQVGLVAWHLVDSAAWRPQGSYLGPSVSFAPGRLWVQLGASVGLDEEDLRVRLVVGIRFPALP